jgi:hypothetical protein
MGAVSSKLWRSLTRLTKSMEQSHFLETDVIFFFSWIPFRCVTEPIIYYRTIQHNTSRYQYIKAQKYILRLHGSTVYSHLQA